MVDENVSDPLWNTLHELSADKMMQAKFRRYIREELDKMIMFIFSIDDKTELLQLEK